MEQNSGISTLIFDFGGVIINLDINRCISNFKELGFDGIDQYLGNFVQSDFFLQYEKGQIDTHCFRDKIRTFARKNLTDEQIDKAWNSFLRDIPQEKLELLSKLKKKYRLLLLSNTNPLHIAGSARKEFARYGKTMDDYFDKCYFSYEMGLAKPQAEIFEAVLNDAEVKAEECLFLDDGVKNIEQADRLGIRTYLIDPKEDLSFLLTIDK